MTSMRIKSFQQKKKSEQIRRGRHMRFFFFCYNKRVKITKKK